MEGYVILILLVIGVPIVVAIWLIARAVSAKASIEELRRRLSTLEIELLRVKEQASSRAASEPTAQEAALSSRKAEPERIRKPKFAAPEEAPALAKEIVPDQPALAAPPPVIAPIGGPVTAPPGLAVPPVAPPPVAPPTRLVPAINW